jgi:hypothetical protein
MVYQSEDDAVKYQNIKGRLSFHHPFNSWSFKSLRLETLLYYDSHAIALQRSAGTA